MVDPISISARMLAVTKPGGGVCYICENPDATETIPIVCLDFNVREVCVCVFCADAYTEGVRYETARWKGLV